MGFTFVNPSGKQADVDFAAHVRRTFVPFARQALDCILVHGFVVYGILPPSSSCQFPTPYMYANESFEASMTTNEHSQLVMTVDDVIHPKRKKHSVFIHDMPAADGSLTSRLALVSKCIAYMEEIEKNDIQAYSIRARPPVLTRANTDKVFDSRTMISGSQPGLRAQEENDTMTIKNRLISAQFKQQQELIKSLNTNRIDSSSQFWTSQMDPNGLGDTLNNETDGFIPRFIPLPTDVDVAQYGLPEEKKDLAKLQQFTKSQVCMGLGVPETLLEGNIGGHASGSVLTGFEEFMRVSLSPLRESINDLMIRLFSECFVEEGTTSDDEVMCFFPSLQDPTLLRQLFTDGLITRTALGKAIRPMFNLESVDLVQDVAEHKQAVADLAPEVYEQGWGIRVKQKEDTLLEKKKLTEKYEKDKNANREVRRHEEKNEEKDAKSSKSKQNRRGRRNKQRTAQSESSSSSESDSEHLEKDNIKSKKTRSK